MNALSPTERAELARIMTTAKLIVRNVATFMQCRTSADVERAMVLLEKQGRSPMRTAENRLYCSNGVRT